MIREQGRLGIMVAEANDKAKFPPFADAHFYRQLCLQGAKLGLVVFVFTPEKIDWSRLSVSGYAYDSCVKRWMRKVYPLPDLLYDRVFFTRPQSFTLYRRQIRLLRQKSGVLFLSHGLNGKWQVQQLLASDPNIAAHLPATELVNDESVLNRWLNREREVFLKPQAGSQGRGVMHIASSESRALRYTVRGRNQRNEPFHYLFNDRRQLCQWLRHVLAKRRYIVQPYLPLVTASGAPFDIRSFVQKNRSGRWQWIGMAARIGEQGGVTANLHGGGKATDAAKFLTEQYGEQAGALIERIRALSLQVARTLESKHGRLLELGLDFGIDRAGKLWLLEANSKPGRSIFLRTENLTARMQAVSNPIHYASYLWDRQLGG